MGLILFMKFNVLFYLLLIGTALSQFSSHI